MILMQQNLLLHILLIDDDEDDKELFKEAFHDITPDSVISTATSCMDLVNSVDDLHVALPDVIFLDLNMPRMDGFECLDLLKSIDPINNIPVFIYSTTVNPSQMLLTYQKGASMFFQKPATFEGIKKLIRKILVMPREQYYPQMSWENFLVKSPELI